MMRVWIKRAVFFGTLLFATSAFAQQTGVGLNNCSGTIASGGTAQVMVAASNFRRGIVIQNLSTDMMWINFIGTAVASTAGSFALSPASATAAGGSFTSPAGFAPAISVIAATTSDAFSCVWW